MNGAPNEKSTFQGRWETICIADLLFHTALYKQTISLTRWNHRKLQRQGQSENNSLKDWDWGNVFCSYLFTSVYDSFKECFPRFTWMPQLPMCCRTNALMLLQNMPPLGLTLLRNSHYSLRSFTLYFFSFSISVFGDILLRFLFVSQINVMRFKDTFFVLFKIDLAVFSIYW